MQRWIYWTFDEINASLLNKCITFFIKNKSLTDPKLLNSSQYCPMFQREKNFNGYTLVKQ